MKNIMILILFFLLSNIAIAADPPISNSKINKEFHETGGGKRFSLGVIKFNANDWRNHNIDQEVLNAPKMNYAWDDKWYYAHLPDSRNKIVVFFWKSLDRNISGWVAVKNNPNSWYYRKNGQSWRKIGDGKKIVNFWRYFGYKDTGNRHTGSLSIDIKNYKNRGGRGEDVIRVSFGF